MKTARYFLLTFFTFLLSSQTYAALTLTITNYTNDEITLTIGGTFDADSIGTSPGYLAIKNDWSNNIGAHTEWYSGAAAITSNSVSFNGVLVLPVDSFVEDSANIWNDAIGFIPTGNTNDVITAGTVVAGSITISGAGMFNPADAPTIELVSGWDNGNDDWARLEARANVNIQTQSVPTLSQYAILLLILSLMFVSVYLKRRNQY